MGLSAACYVTPQPDRSLRTRPLRLRPGSLSQSPPLRTELSRRASFSKVLRTQNRPQFSGGGCQLSLKDLSLKHAVESSSDALHHTGLQSGGRCQSVTNSVT